MIGMDFRRCGKSLAPPSGGHDCWVDAADIAFVQSVSFSLKMIGVMRMLISQKQTLGLPPFHIFAAENMSVGAALRFSILYDSCSVPDYDV